MRTKKVVVEEYNYKWNYEFKRLKLYFQKILKDTILSVEHIGSTSVYGLAAKPIIDIDIVIEEYSKFEKIKNILEKHGYFYEGDLGIKDRHAFAYDENENKFMTHHLYICPKYSKELKRHIAFRDYLKTHESEMKKYGEIKLKAADIFSNDIEGYIGYKSIFIDEIYNKLILKGVGYEK